MKSSMLAILICLTGAFAQANIRTVYDCDQKHGDKEAKIYQDNDKYFICFERYIPTSSNESAPVPTYCNDKIWSTDVDHKDDMIRIDFMRGWMFEGDRRSGILWNDRTTYICEKSYNGDDHDHDHGGDQGDDQGHDHGGHGDYP
jgi:hypothetical protein